jgi:hypothetical protein
MGVLKLDIKELGVEAAVIEVCRTTRGMFSIFILLLTRGCGASNWYGFYIWWVVQLRIVCASFQTSA